MKSEIGKRITKTGALRSAVAIAALSTTLLALDGIHHSVVSQEAEASSQDNRPTGMRRVSTHEGEMSGEMPMDDADPDFVGTLNTVRFEPWQMIEEMFLRDDVVFLMRHGPTDWSKLDEKDVAPTDCDNQRILSDDGARDMRNLGIVLAQNDILPGKIVVSEWCRNQQTLDNILAGIARNNPDYAESVEVETDPNLNLLLSLQGAPDVAGLRDIVSSWDGQVGEGPLLLISHYTNIEELTNFRVFEGEILILDPDRDNRVIGYLRLENAAPDVGHFADEVSAEDVRAQ